MNTAPEKVVVTGGGGFIGGQLVPLHAPGLEGTDGTAEISDRTAIDRHGVQIHQRFTGQAHVWRCLSRSVCFCSSLPTFKSIPAYYEPGHSYAGMAECHELAAPNGWARLDILRRREKGGRRPGVDTGDGELLDDAATSGLQVLGKVVAKAGISIAAGNATVRPSCRTISAQVPQKDLRVLTCWHFAPPIYLVARLRVWKWD